MNDIVYRRIGKVVFDNGTEQSESNWIHEFEDYEDSIVIKTDVKIDSIRRGWVGNITYFATDGFAINSFEDGKRISMPHCVNDVLLVRCGAASSDNAVEWTYTFLKY